MTSPISQPTFERWLDYVFDHPVTDPQWFFDAEYLSVDNLYTVTYMHRLFTSPVEYTQSFTDAQINRGFNYLISPSCSNYAFTLFDETIPAKLRVDTVKAIYTVYKELFVPRCTPTLSHNIFMQEETDKTNPLNYVCFMWWDVFPIGPTVRNDESDRFIKPCLEVMERTLMLESIACQEAALHGLGEWEHGQPDRIKAIINRFLERNPDLDHDLRVYAYAARRGAFE